MRLPSALPVALLLLVPAAHAQDVTGLQDYINLLLHPPANVLTITASQGDGTSCTASKSAGSSIYLSLACASPGGSIKSAVLKASGSATSSFVWGLGDVACLFLLNPSATPIAASGSWTAITAVGVGWQCSTNIRTAGAVSGQTALVTGAVSWP
jgi:hypothetical protein